MNAVTRLSVYGGIVVLIAAGAYAAGAVVDAVTDRGPVSGAAVVAGSAPQTHGGHAQPSGTAQPAGLASTADGYTLAPMTSSLQPGRPTEFAFRITGPDDRPVTAFDVEHEKRMHLIVVRRDTAGFQHVHPAMDADGTWRVPLTVSGGGVYRVFADFSPAGGPATTLGTDVFAPGEFAPLAPEPSRVATAPGGYQVRLDGDLTPGRSSPLTLTVTRDGHPVRDLQPYLGAYGHLVALRGGDLAYLHVHPDGTPGDGATTAGPQIRFHTEVPSAGTYRLFLDFRHDGQVRTAEFTVPSTGTAPVPEAHPVVPQTDGGHGHGGAGDDGH